MKAIQIYETGEPDVLQVHEIPTPEPGVGEVRVKVAAAGLNFIDIYHRKGWYPLDLPFTPGQEMAGIVDAIGEDVQVVSVGDRVACGLSPRAYAEYVLVPAEKLVLVPDAVSLETAAAVMLQGMTAHYLAHNTFSLGEEHTALVHAAAGGVGLLLVQIAKRKGAFVIGTTSTDEKAALAKAAGADEVILYTQSDFETETMRLTDGEGVHVVYDSVGKTTFEKGLNLLRPRGMMALFGQASGPVGPFDPQILNAKGSLFLTRPSLGHHISDRYELLWRASDLFNWIKRGELNVRIDKKFSLAEALSAHRYIEARRTKGKVILIP